MEKLSHISSGNATVQAAVDAAEAVRQSAMTGTPTQLTAKAADIAFYRAAYAAAIANNCGAGQFVRALQELGTGGA